MRDLSRFLAVSALIAVSLAGCSTISPGVRQTNANRLALPVFMIPRDVKAESFTLKAYERAHERGTTANLYIEGSEDATVDGFRLQTDPTPKYPTALALASFDSAKNVIYLGRPCQFRQTMAGAEECPSAYLLDKMYAPEVLSAYNQALDDIKSRYGITGYNLIGFGTGGGLAALLASQRDDVKTLRTVAGVLDTQTYARAHNLVGYEKSFNPINSVPKLMNMPQRHYIAQFDTVVPNAVYHSYAQAFGNDRCLSYTFIQNVDHAYDWTENWRAFLAEPVKCLGPNPDEAERAARQRTYAPEIGPKK